MSQGDLKFERLCNLVFLSDNERGGGGNYYINKYIHYSPFKRIDHNYCKVYHK
jgi:hypothetical protein